MYYGVEDVRALAGFDLAIVEARAWSERGIGALRQAGATVLGYLSVLEEDDPGCSGSRGDPRAEDYLVVEGRRVQSRASSSWMMDPRSGHWVETLLEVARREILAKGCHGLFLDTIGDVEDPTLPERLRMQLIPACALLVKRLRERFPSAILVQNWGLDILYRLALPHLDGVCWENFPARWPRDAWSRAKLDEVERESRRTGARVLLLTQVDLSGRTAPSAWVDIDETRAEAARRGFLFYAAPKDYGQCVYTRSSPGGRGLPAREASVPRRASSLLPGSLRG